MQALGPAGASFHLQNLRLRLLWFVRLSHLRSLLFCHFGDWLSLLI